jgi:hypothetical protein
MSFEWRFLDVFIGFGQRGPRPLGPEEGIV